MADLPLLFLLFILLLSWPNRDVSAAEGTWADYRKHFVSDDGRVIDTGRAGISHSESQGYGLLLSLRNGDRDGFESIRKWTNDNLKIRKDGLLAWSWGKRPDGSWAVIDYNNASDGDLLVSWTLVEAGARWGRNDYLKQGNALANEIRRLLVVRQGDKTLLLPGYYGFMQPEGLVINPAYFVFSAFRVLAAHGDRSFWTTVENDALSLLNQSYRGPLNLPPDWLLLSKDKITIFKEKSDGFGYEAIRIPLYLALADLKTPAKSFDTYLKWVEKHGYLPASVDLTKNRVDLAEGSAGFYAVMGRLAALVDGPELSRKLMDTAKEKVHSEPQDYFSYTLYLLSQPENPHE